MITPLRALRSSYKSHVWFLKYYRESEEIKKKLFEKEVLTR